MTAVSNPYGNAKSESFFKTPKRKEVYLKQYQTFQEAGDDIRQFIEDVYNTKQLHLRLGYLAPSEFERHILRPGKFPYVTFLRSQGTLQFLA